MTALRWISAILSGLVVLTALVIGEGFFGGNATLIEDHGYLGNVIFALAVVQLILAFLQHQKGTVGRNHLLLNGLLIIALFAQIGLGYSGSRSGAAGALVWHLPVGVLIMGISTLNAALFWMRPNRETIAA
jgi:quinol-cytochrome oxidoreductase complex cytochrome b subunit